MPETEFLRCDVRRKNIQPCTIQQQASGPDVMATCQKEIKAIESSTLTFVTFRYYMNSAFVIEAWGDQPIITP
jgi:hypothetical protein